MTEEILEPDLRICDPHHHLWDRPDNRYLLPELLADLETGHRIEATVFVEASAFYSKHKPAHLAYVGETEFAAGVGAMADSGRYGPVRACAGIVGRAALDQGASVAETLAAHVAAGAGRFRGVRHIGAWDASPDIRMGRPGTPPNLYGTPAFREGFAKLAPLGLSFEAWQFHPQLPDVTALARAFPETPIMLNHVGGPLAIGPYAGKRDEVFADWSRDLRELATCPNVWVKLGGLAMATNGPPAGTTSAELAQAWRPYLETCIEAFGPQRSLFESNFPVDSYGATYDALWNAFKRIAAGASVTEKAALFYDNAVRFYRLDL